MYSFTVITWSVSIFALLVVLGTMTFREFRKMNRKPDEFTGSDRLAGSAE